MADETAGRDVSIVLSLNGLIVCFGNTLRRGLSGGLVSMSCDAETRILIGCCILTCGET